MSGPRRHPSPESSDPDTVPIPTRVLRRRAAEPGRPVVDPYRRSAEATPWWQRPPQRTAPPQHWYAPPRSPAPLPPGQLPPAPLSPAPRPPVQRHPEPAGAVERRGSSPRPVLIAAGLAVLGMLAVIVMLSVGREAFSGGGTELDVRQAQIGVQQVLTDPINGYGRDDVSNVRCNNGRNPTVKKGDRFTCEVDVNGIRRQVAVLFADDAGTYEVDRPR